MLQRTSVTFINMYVYIYIYTQRHNIVLIYKTGYEKNKIPRIFFFVISNTYNVINMKIKYKCVIIR